MPIQHAKLSASGSSRWLYCTGSIKAEETFKDKSNPAAAEGTTAHELADILLKDPSLNEQDFLGKTLQDAQEIVITQEMIDYVMDYVLYVRNLGGEQFYEERVDFSEWVPEGFGTSDAIVVVGTTLNVVDLKYGKGVPVYAENNTQGMLYALGAYNDYSHLFDIERVRIHIYQPRISNFSEWELSLTELLEFGKWASERAREALSDDAPRTPGDKQCTWCKAKATCMKLADYTQEIISSDFDDLDELPSVNDLTDDRLQTILEAKKLIESYLKAVEEHVADKLFSGESFPGFKLVAGRSLRKWENEEDAQIALIDLLEDDAFEKKLLTPAKAEKALGAKRKDEISHLIVKPEGKPTLAPESDKRPSINDCSEDFENIS
jgi:hypothetical protein